MKTTKLSNGSKKPNTRRSTKTEFYSLFVNMKDMRRVKSAPANLCQLVHRKKVVPESKPAVVAWIPVDTRRVMRKGDVFDAVVVGGIEDECNITDDTEQFAILYLIRHFLSRRKQRGWTVFYEFFVRVLTSYVKHSMVNTVHDKLHSADRKSVV